MNINSIAYDRSTGNWVYAPEKGEKQLFPAGNIGKRAAIRAKIVTEAPIIAVALDRITEQFNDTGTTRRAEDGALFVVEGLVIETADWDHPRTLARVAHTNKPKEYAITNARYDGSLYKCTCPDWQKGFDRDRLPELDPDRPETGAPAIPGIGWMCKHCWAYYFGRNTGRPLTATNPYNEILGCNLYDKLYAHTRDTHAQAHAILSETTVIGISSGYFHVYYKDDENIEPVDRQYLETAVLEATAKSIQLMIHS